MPEPNPRIYNMYRDYDEGIKSGIVAWEIISNELAKLS